MDAIVALGVTAVVFIALFAVIVLVQRSSKQQQATGRPSLAIRLLALLVGAVGVSAIVLWRISLLHPIALGAIVLLGYGLFGWFGTVERNKADAPPLDPQTIGQVEAPKLSLWQHIKWPVIGCGGLLGLVLVGCAAWMFIVAFDRGEVAVTAEYPHSVRVGEEFDIVVNLTSKSDKNVSVQDINIGRAVSSNMESILAGAEVIAADAPLNPLSSLTGGKSFTWGRELKPGETHVVKFRFKASKAGEYHTDIWVYLSGSTTQVSDIVITITE